jgi:aryl-alcohol dehydrogenase-like predicted oxidoreductase
MKQRRLARTGLVVSEICLGTMTFGNQADERASRAILDRAYAAGVRERLSDSLATSDTTLTPEVLAACNAVSKEIRYPMG